jgi:MYXO-CTERM domain-containing protein
MKTTGNAIRGALLAAVCTLACGQISYADAVLRAGSGATPAELQGVVNLFRADLGGTNNGVGGGPFTSGFRAINWDAVPDSFSAPANLPADFFNANSRRGALFATPGSGFQVSADADNPTLTPVRFGNLDPSYAAIFQTFSAERLFTALGSPVMDVNFFVPDQPAQPAYTHGFGVVFADVDLSDSTSLEFFDLDNASLLTAFAPPSASGGLSFLGVTFTGGERVGRVRITSGNTALGAGVLDGGQLDLVVMDDFFYGEPLLVPEPGKVALLGLGALALLPVWRRRARR